MSSSCSNPDSEPQVKTCVTQPWRTHVNPLLQVIRYHIYPNFEPILQTQPLCLNPRRLYNYAGKYIIDEGRFTTLVWTGPCKTTTSLSIVRRPVVRLSIHVFDGSKTLIFLFRSFTFPSILDGKSCRRFSLGREPGSYFSFISCFLPFVSQKFI